jgi:dTDP-4-amino-4,6-dideoxygalactose transaminase
MGGGEMKYIQEAYSTNWIAPHGANIDNFEIDIQATTGSRHVAALNSGTAALHLALILADVKADDYVICQSMTFSASANPIAYLGAKAIFVDSEPESWNMSPKYLEMAIRNCISGKVKSRISGQLFPPKKPKAIIPVHLYGMPANMEAIMKISRKYGIKVIEDAAESLGSTYKGKAAGTFGEMGILSFNGNKIITTSGGGALISDDEVFIEKARFLATQARDEAPHYQHSQIGYNYRMSNILAGIGRGQIEVLSDRVNKRRATNRWYKSFLAEMEGVNFHSEPNEYCYSNYWLSAITIDPKVASASREEVRLKLFEENIESRPLWKPMHLQPIFKDAPYFGGDISDRLFERGLCLPSGSNLSEDEKDRIQKTLISVLP